MPLGRARPERRRRRTCPLSFGAPDRRTTDLDAHRPARRSRRPAGRGRSARAGAGSRPRAARRRGSARPSPARIRARRPARRPRRRGSTPCGARRGGTGRRRRTGPGPAGVCCRSSSSLAPTHGVRRAARPGRRPRPRPACRRGRARGRRRSSGRWRAGSRLRPSRLRAGRRRRGEPAPSGAGSLHGPSFIARRVGEPCPAPVATAARSSTVIAMSLELVDQHGTQDLLGQRRGGGGERPAGGGVTGREGDRGPGGGIAQEGRNGRRGRPGRQDGAQRGGGQRRRRGEPGRSRSFSRRGPAGCGACRPGSGAAGRPRRASGPRSSRARPASGRPAAGGRSRRGGPRPARGRSPAGRPAGPSAGRVARARTGTVHRVALLPPAPAGDLLPCTPRRPDRDPVQPVAQQVGVADRPGLAGQDEEDGLEGVLGMLHVAQELPADAQHHRPVPADQRREGGLAGRASRPAMNRSRSWRSESPATEPPSKSDPICRTTDPVATRVITACSLPTQGVRVNWLSLSCGTAALGCHLSGRRGQPSSEVWTAEGGCPAEALPPFDWRRPFIPTQGTVAPPAELSRVWRELSSVAGRLMACVGRLLKQRPHTWQSGTMQLLGFRVRLSGMKDQAGRRI